MSSLVETANSSADLTDLLKNPVVSSSDKNKVLNQLFPSLSEESSEFLKLVLSKRREAYLIDMAQQYIGMYNEENGIATATVLSAIPLSDEVMNKVKSYLSSALNKSDIRLVNTIDSSVIGGMVVRYQDRLLDLSVAKELKELRKHLIYN